jgi:O-antigen/teichoic acid export membrane protein
VLLFCLGTLTILLLGFCFHFWGVPVRLSTQAFQDEVLLALLWILPSLPLLLISSAFRGYLEGVGAFRSLNILRIPTGALLVGGPCITALFSPDLMWACVSILLVRFIHLLFLLVLVSDEIGMRISVFIKALPSAISFSWLQELLGFGGWVTLSNVVGPIVAYVDRFVIGALLTASAVVIYVVPYDLVSRLPILIASLSSVLLPELARLSRIGHDGQSNSRLMLRLVRQSTIFSAAVVSVIVLIGWVLTPWALGWWLGVEFSIQASPVTRILLLAFGVNALAQIPFTALQAAGKVRAIALLHLSELLPYGLLLFLSISWLGITGAAWACLIRSVIDLGFLSWMWRRHCILIQGDIKG